MSAVVGERDKALRATVPRNINPVLGKSLSIDVDPPAFHQNSAGIPTILSAMFTATPNGFVGQVMWSITSGGKLTGSTPNERTLLFSDMTVDTVKVTATIVYDGQAYIAVKTFYKVTDGAPGKDGKDANPEDLSAEALATLLEGQITESQLSHDLASRIDLVDGPDSNPSTVQGQIKKETDARVAAITKESADRVTYVQQYTYSEQEIDNSLSVFATTITSQYKAYADGVGGAAVSQSTAYVQSYAYSKSAADSALTAMANTLRSEFATNDGVTTSYLNQYYYTQAQTNSAISSATQTLSTTVGQHTTTLQSQAQSLDGLGGQLTWKIDNNGHVSGFGLASTPINGVPYSTMIFNVDVLGVALPGGTGRPIFTVGQVNGQSQAVFRTDLFVDGGITASKLLIGNADQVVPDSNMLDHAFWGRADDPFIAYPNTFWKSTRVLSLGIRGYEDIATPFFPVEKGGTYKFDVQIFTSGDYQGQLTVVAHLPNQEWCYMGCPQLGYNNGASGLPVSFDGGNHQGGSSFTATRTINTDDAAGKTQIRIVSNVVVGYVQIGGIRITRVMDSVLIKDGAITAPKITVDKLQAISNVVIARVNGQGAGVDMDQYGGRVYDTNGVKRFQWGNLDV